MSTCAMLPDETPIYGTLIAPQLCAIIHQHFFNVRLDVMVDGLTNSVYGTLPVVRIEEASWWAWYA